jgi:transcriptional regulator with XRE-family HTH domain
VAKHDVPSGEPSPVARDDASPDDRSSESRRGSDSSSSPLQDLGAYIRQQRESARLSLRNLAKIAGVSNPYLSQIERGLRKPSAEILQAIAKALEISSETLYIRAGILEEREANEDLETAISRDPHLTDAQRQALIEMYRSFRQLTEMQAQPRSRGLRGLFDVVATGGVDDAAIRAATPDEETEDSA